MYLREQNHVVSHAAKNNLETLQKDSLENWTEMCLELEGWCTLYNVSLVRKWQNDRHIVIEPGVYKLWTDASISTMGVVLEKDDHEYNPRQFFYNEREAPLGIAHKELAAVQRGLEGYGDLFRNERVILMVDNMNVCQAIESYGNRDIKLSRSLKHLLDYTARMNITIKVLF